VSRRGSNSGQERLIFWKQDVGNTYTYSYTLHSCHRAARTAYELKKKKKKKKSTPGIYYHRTLDSKRKSPPRIYYHRTLDSKNISTPRIHFHKTLRF